MASKKFLTLFVFVFTFWGFLVAQEEQPTDSIESKFYSIVDVFYTASEEAVPLLYEFNKMVPKESIYAAPGLNVLGLAYQDLSLYDSAAHYFQKSYFHAIKHNQFNSAFSAKYNYMNLYALNLADENRALAIAYEIQDELLNKVRSEKLPKFYNALTQIYLSLDLNKKAFETALEGLKYAKQENDSTEIQNLFQKISTANSYENRQEEALQAIDSALVYGAGNCDGINYSLLVKAFIYRKMQKPYKSLEQLNKIDTLECYVNNVQLYELLTAYVETYKQLNLPDSAIKYLTIYQDVRFNNLSEESKAKVDAMDKLFQLAQKQQAIAELKLTQKTTENQRNVILFGLIILAISSLSGFAYFNLRNKTQRKIAAQKIAQLESEKEVLSLQTMVLTQEEERERIARDLHDSIGALLSTAKLHISNIESEIQALNDLNLIQSTREIIDHASSEVRKVAHNMMPGVLIKLGLFEGIEDFLENVRSAQNINISFTYDEPEERLPNKYEITIYRLVQELVNNTIKHAQASEIKLMIKLENANQLIIDYKDDGIGFDTSILNSKTNYGLSSLKSRANFLGGTITMQSSPNKGVHIKVTAPLS